MGSQEELARRLTKEISRLTAIAASLQEDKPAISAELFGIVDLIALELDKLRGL